MVKVIIADDEERICKLIEALIDWKSLDMEIVGIAHNGLEASEQVRICEPDILITDIRMPGLSGLELIEQVKKMNKDLEIIVISGYAHFDYAQQAIRFGVGDYLLKPINKTELTATLEKLSRQILSRKESEQDKEDLLRQAKKDVHRLQTDLLEQLLKKDAGAISAEELQETYYLHVKDGIFQAFYLKVDCGREPMGPSTISVLMEKAKETLENSLRDRCTELVLEVKESVCLGIMNYERNRQEEIRRLIKSCLNHLEIHKNLFQPIKVSMALGRPFEEPEYLGESMKEAALLIEERIVKGTGRLLERLGPPSALQRNLVLEKYLRKIVHAVESLSEEQSDAAVKLLEDEIHSVKDAHGYEILNIVYSAADIFTVRAQMENCSEFLEKLRRQCTQCGSLDEVFDCLRESQSEYIKELAVKRDNDTVRPIRMAKQYIQKHYSEPITLEEVCNEVGLSAAYFSALFKKTEGEGFAKYLINIRMEQAKILLRESNIPVGEICRKVGYNDLKHFNHTFEKLAGVKPGTYRKLYG